MKLDLFLEKLVSLTNKSIFRPHKYLLLLAVLDLIKSGEVHNNKIYFNDKLRASFTKHFKIYSGQGDRNRPYTPFFHLRSSGFWYLKAKDGKERQLESLSSVGGPKELIDTVDYAYLSEPVYDLFINEEYSKKIKDKIISILKREEQPESMHIAEEKGDYNFAEINQSLFQHEERAIYEIAHHVKPVGKILSNVHLYDEQSNNYYEYDVILVTKTGIYVVELKHWSGDIQVAQYNWVINRTQYRADPHKINTFKCKILKGIYQHHFRTYPNIWVESVLVLTNPDSTVEGASSPRDAAVKNIHNLTFASIIDFIAYLRKKETVSEHILNDNQIQSIIDYLNSLNNPRPSLKYNVSGYETIEYISQKPEFIELVARPVDGRAKGLNRFRVFRIPPDAEPQEKKRFVKRAYNTLDAVSQIGDHPHIHKVWVMKNDDGDIIEGSEWSETGTLQDYIQEHKGKLPTEIIYDICYGIAQALSKAHEVNVIHRALKPENVLIMNNIPKLINFDLSYQIEENRLTVIADVSKLKDDGYIAPEIIFGQDIDEGTDYFSLGVIAYELFTGKKPFSGTREFVAQGGILNQKSLQKLAESGASENAIEAIMGMTLADRQKRLKDSSVIVSAFRPKTEKGDEYSTINAVLQPGCIYDVYEIVELIDKGATAQIYTAKTIQQKIVILKLFNKEIPREKIFREAEITSAVQSAYVVHCDNKIGHWNNDRFFLVLGFVEGETLRKIIDRNEKPDPETFRTITLSLMDAIEAFHRHRDEEGNHSPYLHGDIKPENIIITKDKKPVLIDCGSAGQPRIDVFEGTSGYIPPDNIIGTDMKFSQDGDLFALGVTLWEWVFGTKPYENPAIGDVAKIHDEQSNYLTDHMNEWLIKAVATKSNERFATVQEMRTAFTSVGLAKKDTAAALEVTAPEPKHKKVATLPGDNVLDPVMNNPFVFYLNTLFNASANNENATAESQIGHPFFRKIAVENPLVKFIYQKLAGEKYNIILTGNAGDGKTTIAADIYAAISGKACTQLNKIEDLGRLVIVKDMSELSDVERTRVLCEAVRDKEKNYLVVSNTGTLLESYKRLNIDGQRANASELLEALEADTPQSVFNAGYLIINIGRMDSIDTAVNVFKRMVETGNWEKCSECKYSSDCPILINVRLLQDALDTVCERITMLYRRLYEYDIRLTMRQMTGHLAYAITAGLNCNEIANLSLIARQEMLFGTLFFNRFFGDNGKDVHNEALQLQPIRQIRKVDFGAVLHPDFERITWIGDENTHSLRGYPLTILQKLNDKYDKNNPNYRQQVRRLIYFFKNREHGDMDNYIHVFLHSPMLVNFLEFTSGLEKIPLLLENKYRIRIMHVLQEYFSGVRLPEEVWQASDLYITLNRRFVGSGTQMVLANFRIEDFKLIIEPRYKVLGSSRGILSLKYMPGGIEMDLDLPFLDYVERRYQGEIAEELSAYYANRLEQFKVRLLNYYLSKNMVDNHDLRILRLDSNRAFKVMRIIVSDNGLEVIS